MRNIKVMFVFNDAGGTVSVLPVLDYILKHTYESVIVAAGPSKKIMKCRNIEFHDGDNINSSNVRVLLNDIDIVVTGTSYGLTIEDVVITEAKLLEIKTISILDYWCNYTERFKELPDEIIVMDKLAFDEMKEEGFDPGILKIMGNPAFDELASYLNRPYKKRVLYVSQEILEKDKFGFSEYQVFEDIKKLSYVFKFCDFYVRIHPREDLDKYDLSSWMQYDEIDNLHESIDKSDLIIGMNSIALLYGVLFRKKVISYQPNLKVKDPLISNRTGVSYGVYDFESFKDTLLKELDYERELKLAKMIGELNIGNSYEVIGNYIFSNFR